ncbi:hypothetical protein [Streptomyces sviceus]|uniref:hypothetical protein n=1 Tax=Streptomyces sviceus TaxID=285530 RepID=UPI00368D0ABB
MGVGRFVCTPALPLMHTQAGLSAGAGLIVAPVLHHGHGYQWALLPAAPVVPAAAAAPVCCGSASRTTWSYRVTRTSISGENRPRTPGSPGPAPEHAPPHPAN